MTNKLLPVVIIILSIAAIAVHNAAIHPWMLDDAFISFRYAENLSSGHGPVYNVGEKVEGYTSFSWVVLLALGNKVGFDTVLLSKILGVIFSVACIILLASAHRFVKHIDQKSAVIAALFLGTYGVFTPWATSGMEVALFTFLVLLSLLLHLSTREADDSKRRLRLLGIICALSALTRPEGVLIFAVLLADQLLRGIKKRNGAVMHLALSFLAVYIPYFAWRYWYYGYPLPNTFYGKVGASFHQIIRGAQYLAEFAIPSLFLVVAAVVFTVLLKKQRTPGKLHLLLVMLAAYASYVVLIGGDCMPAFRFLTPMAPVFCLVSGVVITSLIRAKIALTFAIVVVVFYNLAQMRSDEEIYHHIRTDLVALNGKEVGLWLRANLPPNAVIATNTAGSIPYFSKLKTIDMLGMNDVHIAHRKIPSLGQGWPGHEKGDGFYVLSKRPDYIMFGSSLGSLYPAFPGDHEIAKSPMFLQLYSFRVVKLESGKKLLIYERKHNGD
jgi:arabinofuranosyltransferase